MEKYITAIEEAALVNGLPIITQDFHIALSNTIAQLLDDIRGSLIIETRNSASKLVIDAFEATRDKLS